MRQVYIVEGSTGEYSDHRQWPVAAYLDEAKAANKVQELETVIRTLTFPEYDYESALPELKKHDPNADIDYTGVRYYMYSVDLIEGDA